MNKHDGFYSYDDTDYVTAKTPVVITCPRHGGFLQKPVDHLSGSGCPKCGGNKILNYDDFLKKVEAIHGNTYSYYTDIEYRGKIKIRCTNHGDFFQYLSNHLKGHGCPKCYGNYKLSTKEFIDRATRIYGLEYDYSKADYRSMHSNVTILCNDHGEFVKTPSNHLRAKQGCPRCGNTSKMENEWLDRCGVTSENRQARLVMNDGRTVVADGYEPSTKTVYEFYGDYWHGNPMTYRPDDVNKVNNISFHDLYTNTVMKESLYIRSGYQLITMWEYNFIRMKNDK